MWVIFFITGIIVLCMSALLLAYLDLRDTVEIMKNTINFQNERYMSCLEGWKKAIQSVEEVVSINEDAIQLNKQLYSELYDNKEDDNNECE